VCEKKNSVATACAVARAFPLYSAKTSEKKEERNVNVSFLYVDQNGSKSWPNEDDIKCFNALTQSIRLTAKIVEKPCAEMNTDLFLEVSKKKYFENLAQPKVIKN
jgi:probable aminopeptidase NPEPL1